MDIVDYDATNDEQPYRVKVSVRNNLLLSAIENLGFKSVAEFCRQNNLKQNSVNALICFREKPLNEDGEFSLSAKHLMEVLGAAPTDLWTAEQLTLKTRKNSTWFNSYDYRQHAHAILGGNILKLDHAVQGVDYELPEQPDEIAEKKDFKDRVRDAIQCLTPRQIQVLEYRFGLNGGQSYSLEEIANMLGCTKERIRQIELKALRLLRLKKARELVDMGYEPLTGLYENTNHPPAWTFDEEGNSKWTEKDDEEQS